MARYLFCTTTSTLTIIFSIIDDAISIDCIEFVDSKGGTEFLVRSRTGDYTTPLTSLFFGFIRLVI